MLVNDNAAEKNMIYISGKVVSDLIYCFNKYGKMYYKFYLESQRESGLIDCLPVTISEKVLCFNIIKNNNVEIVGQVKSTNIYDKRLRRHKVKLSVFALEINLLVAKKKNQNKIYLDGFVCKLPQYRRTPLNKEITDITLAVNRVPDISDYIPCIFWNRNARFISKLDLGARIRLNGRFQSRDYEKQVGKNKDVQILTAYEISVITIIEIITENKGI